MTAPLKVATPSNPPPSPQRSSAVGSLQQRLTLAYCAFTSATLALLLFSLMAVAFAAQLNDNGLYRIAYSDQLSQESQQVIRLRQGLVDGTIRTANLSEWLKIIPLTKPLLTAEAYAQFVAPDGTVLASSESAPPAWAQNWPTQSSYKANMIFDFDNQGPIGAQVFTLQQIESQVQIQSATGAPLGSLKARYYLRNVWLWYWLAGVVVWLVLFLITFGLGSMFGRWAAHPLAQRLSVISQTTQNWAAGDFEQRLPNAGKDEIGRLAGRLNTMAEQLQALLAQRQSLAATEERQRLARELHDSVKQQVFAVSMQLGGVALALPAEASIARILLQDVQVTLQATHAELTSMIFALRPAALQTQGLATALATLVEGWKGRNTPPIEFSATGDQPIALDVEHALFRVAQEGLANAVRHSGANHIQLVLHADSHAATVTISDDGIGFDQKGQYAGLGLISMQTRMREVGGTLIVESAPDRGTQIAASWQAPSAA